jgi:D-alanyl-D-alanine carboxypeptidase (penicillin-binding protein 5/6)
MARRIRIRKLRAAGLAIALAATTAAVCYRVSNPTASDPEPSARAVSGVPESSDVWPAEGQAAFVESGDSELHAGPDQHAAPIASVAKVMTAYLVLRDHPLEAGAEGPRITLTDDDVADTDRRRAQEESIVEIEAGEQLTERQALQALLLPSANNIAAVLAGWDAGSEARFVARMNAVAQSLGMTRTRYTDPSGYDPDTVSTAADQVRIVERAMRVPAFAELVATSSATLPVAGDVHKTNALLGHDGFVGVKTGSDAAAGGCFAFRAIRRTDGKWITVTGVVLGQPGHDRIAAGLIAARAMVDRIVIAHASSARPTTAASAPAAARLATSSGDRTPPAARTRRPASAASETRPRFGPPSVPSRSIAVTRARAPAARTRASAKPRSAG